MEQNLKIDFGCGKHKQEGFIGVDVIAFEGVDVVMDIGKDKWPWEDNSVIEAHASHFVEHLKPMQRVHFVNELFRVMKKPVYDNGKLVSGFAKIITPHWASCRAYGDLTHEWPPVSEFWYFYLSKDWRKDNAPHNDFYTCDFDTLWDYSLNPVLIGRNDEYVRNALSFYKEAALDMVVTLTKK